MRRWVITGGLACGKSSVTELLRHYVPEAAMFSCDAAVHELLDKPEVGAQIGKTFGAGVLAANGIAVNRDALRAVVFESEEKRLALESILHPLVLGNLERSALAAAGTGRNLFVAEVPLYYEIGESVPADLVITVACSRELQKRRMKERRRLDDATCEQMLATQWPVEVKIDKADVVLWNDGERNALEDQVLLLANQQNRE
ncbi:MAG: dephospho-CoA kinase [Verrucomicrobiaceae bacterium]|nr:dephospho-CoA kinase [Verrucomicrobiaceae bacterium]